MKKSLCSLCRKSVTIGLIVLGLCRSMFARSTSRKRTLLWTFEQKHNLCFINIMRSGPGLCCAIHRQVNVDYVTRGRSEGAESADQNRCIRCCPILPFNFAMMDDKLKSRMCKQINSIQILKFVTRWSSHLLMQRDCLFVSVSISVNSISESRYDRQRHVAQSFPAHSRGAMVITSSRTTMLSSRR